MVMPYKVLISRSVKTVPRNCDECVSEGDGEKMGKEKIKDKVEYFVFKFYCWFYPQFGVLKCAI